MSKNNSSLKIITKGNNTPLIHNDEQSSGNTTNHDSLHDTNKIIINIAKVENNNDKKNNFFMALQSLKNSSDNIDDTNISEGINEFSEINTNQTKEENISKYIHRPLIKQIIKNGNNLNTIIPLTQFGTSINNPYAFNYNLRGIIDIFKNNKIDNNKINNNQNCNKNIHTVTINATSINKNKYKKIFNEQYNNKIMPKNNKNKDEFVNLTSRMCNNAKMNKNCSTDIKPFYFQRIIDDLEKPVDIKIKDYENTINIIKKKQTIDNNLIKKSKVDKCPINKDKLKSLVKNLKFQEMSNNEKLEEKEGKNDEKDKNYTIKIKNMIISKKNTSTAQKIKKKYERSEIKKRRILQISADVISRNKKLLNLIENDNKENIPLNGGNNIELTKKIIKKINEMTTIKADYNNNEIIDFNNNNFLINYYAQKDNYNCSTNSKKITKNLLNMFNSCSKNLNIEDSHIENQSIKNINTSSFQEIIDLFSDKSNIVTDKNENNNAMIKDTQKKLSILNDFNSLFESNLFNNNSNINNSKKKDLIINSSIISPDYLSKKKPSGLLTNKNKYRNENNSKTNKNKNKTDNKDKVHNSFIYYSPLNQKMRKFDIDSPFNSSMYSNEYTIYNFPPVYGTDIKLKNSIRSQEIMNKIMKKNNFTGRIRESSESFSIINTQSQNSFNKIFYKTEKNKNNQNTNSKQNNNNNDVYKSKNDSYYSLYRLNETQLPNTIYDISFYLNLLDQSKSYIKINPSKLLNRHPTIKWEDRLIILLWMMKNCEEFAYKRDTFHYSIFYFDLFLFQSKEEIKKKDLKLIGITCISLSAKIEEVQIPKLIEYSKSIDPKCTDINIIVSMEQKICSTLKWKLIPITIETWLNWYTCQWDLYIDSSPEIICQLLEYIDEDDIIYFKKQNDKAYSNYRRIYQLIDLISLDSNNYIYDKRGIVAACFLECICFEYKLKYSSERKKIYSTEKEITQNFIDVIYNMYKLFIEQSFDFSFNDNLIQECIKFVFKFSDFSFSYNLPLIYKAKEKLDEDIENNYEDFISYQTTNSDILPFFEKMYKFKDKNNKINHEINV